MKEDELQAFLDVGTSFEGKVSFSGTVRMDGHFKGDAIAEGVLIVGETGTVEADLSVRSLVVRGSVVGDVVAKEIVEIGPNGRIEGRVSTPRLKVHDGARVTARLEMGELAEPGLRPVDPEA